MNLSSIFHHIVFCNILLSSFYVHPMLKSVSSKHFHQLIPPLKTNPLMDKYLQIGKEYIDKNGKYTTTMILTDYSEILQSVQNNNIDQLNQKLASITDAQLKKYLINYSSTQNDPLLFIAAQKGYLKVVQALLAAGAKPNQARTSDGATPLHAAALNGHSEVAKALLTAGANRDQALTTDGTTPLFIAAQNGHSEIVKILLAAGANRDQALTTDGATPLFIAAQNGHSEIVQALLNFNANSNQARTSDGATPLFIAAENGRLAIVDALLTAKANRDQALTTDGATPLSVAAQNGHLSIIHALLAAGADLNARLTTTNETPFDIAIKNKQLACACLLHLYSIKNRTLNPDSENQFNSDPALKNTYLLIRNDYELYMQNKNNILYTLLFNESNELILPIIFNINALAQLLICLIQQQPLAPAPAPAAASSANQDKSNPKLEECQRKFGSIVLKENRKLEVLFNPNDACFICLNSITKMIEEKETTATIEKFILLNANYGHFVCTQCFIELIYKNGRFNFLPGDTEIPNITRPIAQRA